MYIEEGGEMKKFQYQKKGLALMFLAKKFLVLRVNERIPTVDQLCADSGLSRGTIQNALERLKDDAAIATVSKGHLGTFLVNQDQNKLLGYLDNRMMVCAMPLPYTKHYEGLATGMYQSFQKQLLALNMAYVNGSLNRLEGLQNDRYDSIIVSGLTAQYLKRYYDVEVIKLLPERSYVTKHVLVFNKKRQSFKITNGMRIGIDTHSIDYSILTKKILKKHQVSLIETPYNQIVERIEAGSIDAAIWNLDEVASRQYPVAYMSINDEGIGLASRAAIICLKNNTLMKQVINNFINWNKLLDVQKKVINGEILPEY